MGSEYAHSEVDHTPAILLRPPVRCRTLKIFDFSSRRVRLICAFCSSGQRFAFGFLQIPLRDEHPYRSANGSPDGSVRDLHPQVSAPCRAQYAQGVAIGNPLCVHSTADCSVPFSGRKAPISRQAIGARRRRHKSSL